MVDLAESLDRVVAAALAEDVGDGDVTTEGVVPAEARCTAVLPSFCATIQRARLLSLKSSLITSPRQGSTT